jgi:hypothetical protein
MKKVLGWGILLILAVLVSAPFVYLLGPFVFFGILVAGAVGFLALLAGLYLVLD